METPESDTTIKDKVDKITTINFSVTKCPLKVYEEFVAFCKEETNDSYSMGLKWLLEAKKANIKEVMLYEKYMELKQELKELRDLLADKKEEKKELPKTMGSAKKV